MCNFIEGTSPVIHIPKMAHIVEAAGSVSRAHHFEAERRPKVPHFQEHQSQILNKQQRIHQRDRVTHYAPVIPLSRLQHPHAIEQPIGGHEEEHQSHQEATENEEPRQRGAGRPEKEGPGRDEKDKEFEGERDVKAFAGGPAGLQRVTP